MSNSWIWVTLSSVERDNQIEIDACSGWIIWVDSNSVYNVNALVKCDEVATLAVFSDSPSNSFHMPSPHAWEVFYTDLFHVQKLTN